MECININYNITDINIGHGSFSTVYLGIHNKKGIKVAIKKINLNKIKNMRANFINEINMIKKLNHPNIITTYDVINNNDTFLYIVLEYCPNGTLHDFLQNRPLKEKHAKNFFTQIADAIKYLLDNNIIHRDLKPQNILLDKDNKIKLTDFDFAKIIKVDSLVETICGTPLYMAPEIIKFKKYTIKSDLWSLGIILFQMLTGKHPYKAKTHYELVKKIESEHIIIPSKFNLSKSCYNLIHLLLQKDQNKRINWDEFFNHPWININTSYIKYNINDVDNYIKHNNIKNIKNIKNINYESDNSITELEQSIGDMNFEDLFDSFSTKIISNKDDLNDNLKYPPIKNIDTVNLHKDIIKSKPIKIKYNNLKIDNNYFSPRELFNTPLDNTPVLNNGFVIIKTPPSNSRHSISKLNLGSSLFNYMNDSINYVKSFFIYN